MSAVRRAAPRAAQPGRGAARLLLPLFLALTLGMALPAAAQSAASLNPAQTAYFKAENRRIEDRFVAEVARVVGTSPARVRTAMPDERRITVAVSRLIDALEKDLGAELGPEQKAAILAADENRKREQAALRQSAGAR